MRIERRRPGPHAAHAVLLARQLCITSHLRRPIPSHLIPIPSHPIPSYPHPIPSRLILSHFIKLHPFTSHPINPIPSHFLPSLRTPNCPTANNLIAVALTCHAQR
eukprot:366387-Chlamydomonas_euryale.AAC.21